MTHLQIGDAAPAFSASNENNEIITLDQFKGKKLVLFFYPKDNTPGCTAEVCSLRDGFKELTDAGYQLLGVSPDSSKKHQNFIAKFELPFSLLVDADLAVIKAYNVWGPKKFMGREYDGLHRTTFVIDEKGLIEQIFTKVKTKTHAQQILETAAV